MKTPWIVIDAKDQVMRCQRCQETEPLSTINYREVRFACGIMNAFVEAHKECKEPTA